MLETRWTLPSSFNCNNSIALIKAKWPKILLKRVLCFICHKYMCSRNPYAKTAHPYPTATTAQVKYH